MTDRVTYITPRNSGFSGGKIGLDGNTIWLLPQTMETRFNQAVLRISPVNGDIRFEAKRELSGVVAISGRYETADGHTRNALKAMSELSSIKDVTLSLDNGFDYVGDLVVLSDRNAWNRDGTEVDIAMTFQFTGTIVGDGWDGTYDAGSSGEIVTNLKEVEGASPMSYSRSSFDRTGDYATEPFVVVGVLEGSGVPLADVEARVVAAMGGYNHFWRGDATLPFSRINLRWAGRGLIVGNLIYDRNALDCKAYEYRSDIGFIVKGSVGEVVTGDSGSDADNVCTDLATSPFGIRFVHWRNRTVPYRIHLLPCVSSTNPHSDTNLTTMIGTINSNAITIDGVSIPGTELRFDGAKELRKIVGPAGTKYFFYLKFSQLNGGWTDGTLTCIRMEPLPLEGTQTQPSYTTIASVIQLYDYSFSTFSSLATLCPACYG